jgi:hypothetical protein
MKQCVICNQEQPPTAFSTLARRRGRTASPTEIESVACTPCYWMQLVTHYPRLSVDDNGRCAVAYMPSRQAAMGVCGGDRTAIVAMVERRKGN